jgi:uncharacterized membrane protein YphA (DoxX/SURF4 family)
MSPDLALICQLLLGGVFGISAITKLRRPSLFVAAVEEFRLVPKPLVGLAALGTIALEAFCALTLASGVGLDAGRAIAVLLLSAFTALMVRNALSRQPLPCHCFGADREVRPYRTLGRLALLNGAALGILLPQTGASGVPTLAHVLSATGLAVLGLWFLELPTLIRFHRTPIPTVRLMTRRVSFRGLPLAPVDALKRR